MTEHEPNIQQSKIIGPSLPEHEASRLRAESVDLVPGGIPKESSFFPTGDTTRVAPARTPKENLIVKGYQISRRFSQ